MNFKTTSISAFAFMFILVLSISFVNAVALETVSVQPSPALPGQDIVITISLKNNLDKNVKDVSFSLDLTDLPFISQGSSEQGVKEIREDKLENLGFVIRVSDTAKPGDYNIPYILNYQNATSIKKGTVGVRITAEPDLSFSLSAENAVIGQKGRITLKIINKGLGDARFVSVKMLEDGFTLLSDREVYIGTIDSDDFETASFNVIFNQEQSTFRATVSYKDIENKESIQNINLAVAAYTKEKAIELGIVKKDLGWIYGLVAALIIAIWIVVRRIRKAFRKKRSLQARQQQT